VREREELIAQHVADRAELAGSGTITEHPRRRICAAVGEFLEVDGDQRQRTDVACKLRRLIGRREPDASVTASDEGATLRLPEGERDDDGCAGGDIGKRGRLAQQRPAIVGDRAILNELRHTRVP
jgi:hypothetical protein